MQTDTKIILVRHGETDWNKQKRWQGNLDSPLTRNGIEQAQRVKETLETFALDHAYVSPLKRTMETLRIIMQDRDLKFSIKDNLREINLGPWEGKRLCETEESHPKEYAVFWERPDLFNLPGADTFEKLQHRMVEQLQSILTYNANKTVLVVSHGMAIKVALAHYSSIPLSRLAEIPNPVNGELLSLCKRGEDVFISKL